MIENVVGFLPLPLGIAVNFLGRIRRFDAGISFTSKFVLRLGIALLGLSLAGCTTVTQVDLCSPTSLVLHVSGTAVTPGGAVPVEITDTLSFASLSTRKFAWRTPRFAECGIVISLAWIRVARSIELAE